MYVSTRLLMTSVWYTQTLSMSYLYSYSINLLSLLVLCNIPKSCSPEDINDTISSGRAIILYMSSALPNIIMPGDFNFLDINWSNPDFNCTDASPLNLFSDWLFSNQQVSAPTCKSNILD